MSMKGKWIASPSWFIFRHAVLAKIAGKKGG
jgi:hypothetical protein